MAVTLQVPQGLARETDQEAWSGRALSPTRGEVEPATLVTLDDADLVEVEWEDGAVVVTRAGQLARSAPAGPVELAGGRGERDPLSNAIVRLVVRPVVRRTVEEVCARIDARFLEAAEGRPEVDERKAEGLLWYWDERVESFVLTPTEPTASSATLLLVHGTFSTFRDGFADLLPGGVADADWHRLTGEFDRVIAFDHPTLTRDPLANALRLATLLPRGARLFLLSHSRGGLVAEVLAVASALAQERWESERATALADAGAYGRRLRELRARSASELVDALESVAALLLRHDVRVERHVRVGCPARGTTLMAQGLDLWLNVSLNALGLVPVLRASPLFALTRELVRAVVAARRDPEALPGLHAMDPRGPFLRWLTSLGGAGSLVAVAGEAAGGSVVNRLADVVAGVVFPDRHDLVVDTDSMEGGPEHAGGEETRRFLAEEVRGNGRLDHFSYFRFAPSRRAVLRGLRASPPLAEAEADGATRALPGGEATPGPASASAAPGVGASTHRLFLLPDVFGSVLTRDERDWWPSPSALAGRPLEIDAGEVSATRLVPEVYGPITAALREAMPGAVVEPIAYDWRLPLDELVAKVRERVLATPRPEEKVAFVAHGLGGLVLARALDRAGGAAGVPALPDGRVALLGVPLRGTWWAWDLIRGAGARSAGLGALLARLVPPGGAAADALASLPSLWALLPPPEELEAAAPGWWATVDPKRRAWVPTSSERRRWFAESADRVLVLAGTALPTPGAPGTEPTKGDGRVSHASTIPWATEGKARVATSRAAHAELGASGLDAAALAGWLEYGRPPGECAPARTIAEIGPSVTRAGGAPPPATAPLPGLLPLRRELVDAALGSAPRPAAAPGSLVVEVWRAHPALESDGTLMVVGHPDLARLTELEADLDLVVDGALADRLRCGRYPGALGTWTVAVPGRRRAARCPVGVLVIGLGRSGDVTRGRLIQALTEALVEAGLPPVGTALWPDAGAARPPERTVSFSLLAVGREGLLPHEGTDCLLEAVLRANRRLEQVDGAAPYARVRLVELSEVRARKVLERALQWEQGVANPLGGAGAVSVEPLLHQSKELQRLGAQLDPDEFGRGRVRRVGVRATEDPRRAGFYELDFDHSDGGAREVAVRTRAVWGHVEAEVRRLVASGGWDLAAVGGLRNLLLPPSLLGALREGVDALLVVDPTVAGVPWEALLAPERGAAGVGGISVMRQLRGVAPVELQPVVGNRRALVVCSPGSGASRLRGAEREADAVEAGLRSADYEVVRVGGALGPLQAALAEPFEIVHLVGHGVHDPQDPARSGFVAEGGEVFSAIDAAMLAHHPPAMLFANACHLADMRGRGGLGEPSRFAAGLAEAAIRAGVRTVIAAGWPVEDDAAVVFARTFYDELNAPHSLRTALLMARLAARRLRPDSGTWAAYQGYGDPEFMLPSRLLAQVHERGQSDDALVRRHVASPEQAREVLARLWLRAQLCRPEDEGRRRALRRRVDELAERLPEEFRTAVADTLRAVREVLPEAPVAAAGGRGAAEAVAPGAGGAAEAGRRLTREERAEALLVDYQHGRPGVEAEHVARAWLAARGGCSNHEVARQVTRLTQGLASVKDHDRRWRLVRALQEASPDLLDDPNLGKFGYRDATETWKVHAEVRRAHGYWREVTVIVERLKPPYDPALVRLFLHPTFRQSVREQWLRAGDPSLSVRFEAWGPFTVGVQIESTRLELDLEAAWKKAMEDGGSGDRSSAKGGERGSHGSTADLIRQEPPRRGGEETPTAASAPVAYAPAGSAPASDVLELAVPVPTGRSHRADLLARLHTDGTRLRVSRTAPFFEGARRVLVETELDPAVFADPALAPLAPLVVAALERVMAEGPAAKLTAAETEAMQAFTLMVTRPSLVVRDDAPVAPPPSWARLAEANLALAGVLPAVGLLCGDDTQPCGTGFLISRTHLLTNNHVLAELAGLPIDAWKNDWARFTAEVKSRGADWADPDGLGPTFDTLAEQGRRAERTERVVGVAAPYPDADLAVLELARPLPDGRPLTLAAGGAPEAADHPCYVVGYPGDVTVEGLPPALLPLLFGADPELSRKRLAPGLVRRHAKDRLEHDASTLRGSSGSPVIDLDTHRVLALHFQGESRVRNEAVVLAAHRTAIDARAPGVRWEG